MNFMVNTTNTRQATSRRRLQQGKERVYQFLKVNTSKDIIHENRRKKNHSPHSTE